MLAALELLKARAPQDIAALKGVDLIRVASLGQTGSGRTAGDFNMGGATPPGAAAPTRPTLRLADAAFSDKTQFTGGGPGAPSLPSSFLVILHEVGHAVEAMQLRAAYEEFNVAAAEVAAATQRVADETKTYQAEFDEAKRKGQLPAFWKRREQQHKANEALEQTAIAKKQQAETRIEGTIVTAATVQPLETATAALATAAGTSLTTAKNAVATLTGDALQRGQAYTKGFDDVVSAISTFNRRFQGQGDSRRGSRAPRFAEDRRPGPPAPLDAPAPRPPAGQSRHGGAPGRHGGARRVVRIRSASSPARASAPAACRSSLTSSPRTISGASRSIRSRTGS